MLTRSATRRTDSTASSRNSEAGTPVPSRKGSRVNTPKAAPKLPKKADEKSRQVSKKTTNSDDPSVKEQNSARTSRPTTRTIPKTVSAKRVSNKSINLEKSSEIKDVDSPRLTRDVPKKIPKSVPPKPISKKGSSKETLETRALKSRKSILETSKAKASDPKNTPHPKVLKRRTSISEPEPTSASIQSKSSEIHSPRTRKSIPEIPKPKDSAETPEPKKVRGRKSILKPSSSQTHSPDNVDNSEKCLPEPSSNPATSTDSPIIDPNLEYSDNDDSDVREEIPSKPKKVKFISKAAEPKPTTVPKPKPAKTDSFDKEPVVIVKKKQPEVQKQQSTPARNVTTRRRKAEISQEDETMPPDDPWDSQQPESKSGGRSKKRAKEDDSQQTQDTQQQGNASQSQMTASQGVGTQNSSLSRKALLKNAKLGKMISTGVMNAFRGFIESKDEQGAQTSLKQLRIVYMKSLENPSMKASFSEEFDISFGNLVAGNFDMEARQQAIRLMIKFIYSMAVEDKGTLLLPAFIQYCVTLMTCEDSIVRQNIVFIVGCLFEENKKLNEEILSDEQRNALYRLLLNGHNDKVAVVRAEVVRAVASLQNDDIDSEFTEALEKAPNEILLDSQRDMCMETRAMVVKYRSIQNGDALQSLFKIAESDPILKVRQEAFARIASVDMKLLSEHRRDLTKLTLEALTESGSESRHACRVYFLNQMIDSCVKFLKSEAEKDQQNDSFLASSQPEPEYDEEHFYAVSPYVFLKLFVDMQDLVESVPIVRCLLNLVDNRIKRGQFTSTREQFAEIISRDVFPVVITKKTYTQLISTTYEDQLRFAFFWRVMLEVFIEKCDSMSAERWAILARIAPTLEETCVLVRKICEQMVDLQLQIDAVTDTKNIQGTVCNLLLIMRHIDKEDTGMKSWRIILQDLAKDHLVEQDVMDIVMHDLYHEFYEDDVMSLLVYVLSLIDSEVSIENSLRSAKNIQDSVLLYMSKLVLGLLRTGAYKCINDELTELLTRVIDPSLKSQDAQVVKNAIESLGILAIIDLQLINDRTETLEELMNKLTLRKTCLELVASLVYAHGSKAVREVF